MDVVFINPSRAIPGKVRVAVMARDGMVCRRCGRAVVRTSKGAAYRPDALHLDHVEPWASGGDHTLENLIVCCAECNLRRPKPEKVIRSVKVKAQYSNGTYYWRDAYEPPRLLQPGAASWSVMQASNATGLSRIEVLQMVASGELAGSGGVGPIRVEVPEFIREYVLADRRQRYAENQTQRQQAATLLAGKRDRQARSRTNPELDPEKLVYWQGLIDARRARERQEREARRAAREA